MDQDPEPGPLQPGHGRAQQQHVLEHAAGQRDRAQSVPFPRQQAARLDQRGHAVVETSRDDRAGGPGREVLDDRGEQVSSVNTERTARFESGTIGAALRGVSQLLELHRCLTFVVDGIPDAQDGRGGVE